MTLKVNNIYGTSNTIRVAKPNVIYAPGHIIDVAYNVSMERVYYYTPNNDGGFRGDTNAQYVFQGGTIITPLDVTITPKSPDSWIFVEFNVFYEMQTDNVFSILRDGQLVGAQWNTGTVQGRNTGAGSASYDNNQDSTPSYINLPWIDRPGTTDPVTYSFAVKGSGATAYEFALNATLTNYLNGADFYEQGVSFSIAQEIAY